MKYLAAHLDKHSLFALLRDQAGLVPSHSLEEIRAVSCPGYQAALLNADHPAGRRVPVLGLDALTEAAVFERREHIRVNCGEKRDQ